MIRDYTSIQIAMLVSLMLHLSAYGGWYFRGSFARIAFLKPVARIINALAAEFHPATKTAAAPAEQTITFVDLAPEARQPEPVAPPAPPPTPHTFIETDPEQQAEKDPEHAEYYSDRPSVAANPDNPTGKEGDTPYLEGTETRMASSDDRNFARPAPAPPQPVTPPSPATQATPATKPKEAEKPVELADRGLKAAPPKKTEIAFATPVTPPPAPPQPVLQTPGGATSTSKSKLTAVGVSRQGIAAFNVAGSPFGEYDKKLIAAVTARWYALIDRYGIYERTGDVTLNFELYDDGTVRNLERKANSAGEILALYCEKAIVDSAPFDPFPTSLRLLVGAEPREVNFTFYY